MPSARTHVTIAILYTAVVVMLAKGWLSNLASGVRTATAPVSGFDNGSVGGSPGIGSGGGGGGGSW